MDVRDYEYIDAVESGYGCTMFMSIPHGAGRSAICPS